ncbi:hypothetical protein RBWH47_03142 [Rhodopirellula baltica WH47]|uniref:Uncharacterized protein n=1 Tax=Rhodopirellula baltica WH47 TaxID=991778 RepID=F2B022_RHOBT|nr:hypothetical protein RBWH47_03142 [Rhodopirellula baltica WH47]
MRSVKRSDQTRSVVLRAVGLLEQDKSIQQRKRKSHP